MNTDTRQVHGAASGRNICAQRVRHRHAQVGDAAGDTRANLSAGCRVARAAQGLESLILMLLKILAGVSSNSGMAIWFVVNVGTRLPFGLICVNIFGRKKSRRRGAPGARGVERAPGTVGGVQVTFGLSMRWVMGIVFADLPDCGWRARAEADFGEVGLGLGIVFQLDVARRISSVQSAQRGTMASVDGEIDSAGQHADDEIRHAQSPQTHAGSAQRGQLVMPRMLRERVEQREQQPDGQHQDEKARHHGGGVFHAVPQPELVFLHDVELAEEK